MKTIYQILALLILVSISCEPVFNEGPEVPDSPYILSVSPGNENGNIAVINAVDTINNTDSVFVKDKTVVFSNLYINASLASGCRIEAIEGSTPCGTYGDFSAPSKYRVTAPSGKTADWTVVLEYYVEPIGCLADRWSGELNCLDMRWADYSPTYCTGVKVDDDCSLVNVTFDMWGYGESTEITFKLKLGPIDMESLTGDLTLLEDAFVTAEGADLTFFAGPAGSYSAAANELNIDVAWAGYDETETYKFVITPKE